MNTIITASFLLWLMYRGVEAQRWDFRAAEIPNFSHGGMMNIHSDTVSNPYSFKRGQRDLMLAPIPRKRRKPQAKQSPHAPYTNNGGQAPGGQYNKLIPIIRSAYNTLSSVTNNMPSPGSYSSYSAPMGSPGNYGGRYMGKSYSYAPGQSGGYTPNSPQYTNGSPPPSSTYSSPQGRQGDYGAGGGSYPPSGPSYGPGPYSRSPSYDPGYSTSSDGYGGSSYGSYGSPPPPEYPPESYEEEPQPMERVKQQGFKIRWSKKEHDPDDKKYTLVRRDGASAHELNDILDLSGNPMDRHNYVSHVLNDMSRPPLEGFSKYSHDKSYRYRPQRGYSKPSYKWENKWENPEFGGVKSEAKQPKYSHQNNRYSNHRQDDLFKGSTDMYVDRDGLPEIRPGYFQDTNTDENRINSYSQNKWDDSYSPPRYNPLSDGKMFTGKFTSEQPSYREEKLYVRNEKSWPSSSRGNSFGFNSNERQDNDNNNQNAGYGYQRRAWQDETPSYGYNQDDTSILQTNNKMEQFQRSHPRNEYSHFMGDEKREVEPRGFGYLDPGNRHHQVHDDWFNYPKRKSQYSDYSRKRTTYGKGYRKVRRPGRQHGFSNDNRQVGADDIYTGNGGLDYVYKNKPSLVVNDAQTPPRAFGFHKSGAMDDYSRLGPSNRETVYNVVPQGREWKKPAKFTSRYVPVVKSLPREGTPRRTKRMMREPVNYLPALPRQRRQTYSSTVGPNYGSHYHRDGRVTQGDYSRFWPFEHDRRGYHVAQGSKITEADLLGAHLSNHVNNDLKSLISDEGGFDFFK